MAADSAEAVRTRVNQALDGSPYACSSLRPLAGGNCNFTYHGVLRQPLPDSTWEVLIKHGEDYLASNPDFKLTTSRCVRRNPESCYDWKLTGILEDRGRLPGSPSHIASRLDRVLHRQSTSLLPLQPTDQHSGSRVPAGLRQPEDICYPSSLSQPSRSEGPSRGHR